MQRRLRYYRKTETSLKLWFRNNESAAFYLNPSPGPSSTSFAKVMEIFFLFIFGVRSKRTSRNFSKRILVCLEDEAYSGKSFRPGRIKFLRQIFVYTEITLELSCNSGSVM